MKKSFANLEPPVLAAVIKEKTKENAINAIHKAEANGAMAFDLHLSCLENKYRTTECIRQIVDCTDKPMLGLNYNLDIDTGSYESTEEERVGLLMLATKAGIAAVDLQSYTFDLASKTKYAGDADEIFTKGNPNEVVTDKKIIAKQKALIDELHSMGVEVLLSCHPRIHMNTEQVIALAKYMENRNPDIIKIVTLAENEEQAAEAFSTMVELKKAITDRKIHFHCAGQAGKITRVVNAMLGTYLAFCVDEYTKGQDREQLFLKDFADAYGKISKMI